MLDCGESLAKSMSQYLVDHIQQTNNIKVLLNSNVIEEKGENRLESLTIENSATGVKQSVPAYAMFIFIGARPRTYWLSEIVERDPN